MMSHHEMILNAGVIFLLAVYAIGGAIAIWKLPKDVALGFCALGSFALLLAVIAWIVFCGPGPLEPITQIVST